MHTASEKLVQQLVHFSLTLQVNKQIAEHNVAALEREGFEALAGCFQRLLSPEKGVDGGS